MELSKSQIAALSAQRSRDFADLEYLKQETARTAEQRTQQEEESRVLFTSIEEQNVVLGSRNTILESLTLALKEKENSLDEARTGIFNAMTASAAEKNRIGNLESRIHQIDEQEERGSREQAS